MIDQASDTNETFYHYFVSHGAVRWHVGSKEQATVFREALVMSEGLNQVGRL